MEKKKSEDKTMDLERDELIATLVNYYSQDYHAIRDLSWEELQEIKKDCLGENEDGLKKE
jgi:hypothetical protein